MVDARGIVRQFVDFLMPDLTPHEASLYVFLLRHSHFENGQAQIRIGQRTIAQQYGRGPNNAIPSRTHILRQLKQLQEKGCLKIFDTNREGTLYEVVLPAGVPSVAEKIRIARAPVVEEDFFSDVTKRRGIYDRDHWICSYCGEPVTEDSVTLDHYLPVCKGGTNTKDNLRTSCLLCNSIKSGKTYDEAIPLLYNSIRERARRRNQA